MENPRAIYKTSHWTNEIDGLIEEMNWLRAEIKEESIEGGWDFRSAVIELGKATSSLHHAKQSMYSSLGRTLALGDDE